MVKPKALTPKQITARLKPLREWNYFPKDKAIGSQYNVKDFDTAVKIIQKIAVVAEEANHHPDLHLTGFRHLTIRLKTHVVNGLTVKDFALAAKIQNLLL
jgi:4a-hydroxytetrahydrobiopterin dehydratase